VPHIRCRDLHRYSSSNLKLNLSIDQGDDFEFVPQQPSASSIPLTAASTTPLPNHSGRDLGSVPEDSATDDDFETPASTTMDQQFMRRYSVATPLSNSMRRSMDTSFDSEFFDSDDGACSSLSQLLPQHISCLNMQSYCFVDEEAGTVSFDEESSLDTVQFAKDQRWPLKGEPVCVICGR